MLLLGQYHPLLFPLNTKSSPKTAFPPAPRGVGGDQSPVSRRTRRVSKKREKVASRINMPDVHGKEDPRLLNPRGVARHLARALSAAKGGESWRKWVMACTEGKEVEPVPFLFSYTVWVKVCVQRMSVIDWLWMRDKGSQWRLRVLTFSLILGAGRWAERDSHVYLSWTWQESLMSDRRLEAIHMSIKILAPLSKVVHPHTGLSGEVKRNGEGCYWYGSMSRIYCLGKNTRCRPMFSTPGVNISICLYFQQD